MSTIDKRVVELELDNSKFNRDVKSTQSTLEKLKKSLSFDDVSESIEKFSVKFSTMDLVVMTAITNISNRLTNIGVNLVKSLSIDNISAGWSKFEQKTKSVATIMAQTIKIAGNEITEYSAKMEAVDDQLTKLNWFTDQTSYNFTDMVENIGKFTAAGQDLDKSVDAMMGIANWAALSGQNAATASRAMYQLAQAMSKGTVQLIDYKSIQNANMDTQEFRQTVLDTAVALGKLTKEGEKYVSTTGGKTFTRNSFTESLQDKWFTSEVLTESLKKYSSAVERIYEISEETGLTAAQVMARYGDELDEFGLKAFRAAQEARTFTDTINAIKDAVSTGWLNTAEQIFGSYTESKVLWSDLADSLYEVFAAGGDVRNQILKVWSSLSGREDLFAHDPSHPEKQGAFWNMYDAIVALVNKVKTSFRQIFSLSDFTTINEYVNDTANKFKTLTARLQESTKRFKDFIENNSLFSNTLKTVFGSFKIVLATIKAARLAIDPLISTITNFAKNVLTNLSNRLSNISWIEKILESISQKAIKVKDALEKLLDKIGSSDKLYTIIEAIRKVIDIVKEAHIIKRATEIFNDFFESFVQNGGTINNFKKIVSGVANVIGIFIETSKNLVKFIMTTLGPALTSTLGKIARVAGAILGKIVEVLSIFFEELSRLTLKNKDTSILDNITSFIESIKLDKAAISTANAVASVLASLKQTFATIVEILQYTLPLINAVLKVTSIVVKEVNDTLVSILTKASEHGGIRVLLLGLLAILTIATAILITVAKTTKKAVKILDSVRHAFDALAFSFQASAFMAIANALLQIAGAFYLLSKMDIKSLGIATLAMNILAGTMVGMYMLVFELNKYSKGVNMKQFNKSINQLAKISFAFIEMSIALTIVSKAAKTFASMNEDDFVNSLIGLGACTGALFALVAMMSKFKMPELSDSFKLVAATTMLVSAVSLMSGLMKILGNIDWKQIISGTFKMATMFAIMFVSFSAIDEYITVNKDVILKLLKISVISSVLKSISVTLTKMVKYLDSIDYFTIISSLVKLSALLAYMTTIMNAMSTFNTNVGNFIKFSITVGLFVSSIKTMANGLVYVASVPFLDILKSLLNLSVIVATILTMANIPIKVSKILAMSASMIILSSAMTEIAKSLMYMSAVPWQAIFKALINIAGILGMVFAICEMKSVNPFKMLVIAVSITVLANALNTYAEGLLTLANVPFSSLFKGMLALATGFTLLALVSKIMEPSVTVILKTSFAVLILGGAMLITATAIATLAETFNTNVDGMWQALSDFINGSIDFLTTNVDKVITLVETFVGAILDALINLMPKIGEVVAALSKTVLKLIRDTLPDLLDTVAVLITGVLKMLRENIAQWTQDLVYILIATIDELTRHLPELNESLTEFLVTFIETSLLSLAKRLDRILNAAITFVLTLIHDLGVTIKNRSRDFSETFIEFGINLIEGLKIGIVSGVAKLLEKIPTIGKAIADGFRNVFGIHSPSTVMEEMGMYLDAGLAKGVKENVGVTTNSITDSMTKVLSAVDDTLNSEMDDSLVLTPVIDLSQVNAGVRDISSLMSSVSGASMSVTGRFASSASSEIARNTHSASDIQNGITTNTTNNDNYYVTFNVETNDPEELAHQLDSILQRNRLKANFAKGGY